MDEVSEREASKRFAKLMNEFIASPPATAKVIVDALVHFFRDVRITGAEDKLQFEWGANKPHQLTNFTDLRRDKWDGWDEAAYEWIGVSREIGFEQGDDDTALCAFIYFGKAAGDEPSGTIATKLKNLDVRLEKFLQESYVAKLLAGPASRINAFACEVG